MKQKRYYLILFFILIVLLPICSCNSLNRKEKLQQSFDALLHDIFVSEVTSNSLSLNYSLADPENYGIYDAKVTLGEYSVKHMTEDLSQYENYLQKLNSYDFSMLEPDQQLTYDILTDYLEQEIQMGNYLYYNECLGPTTGLQAQLPILLAEYNFDDTSDIEDYLSLLPCVYPYFTDIIQFEKEKSARGLFMSDEVADQIIAQCGAFIADSQNNFLIRYFDEKITAFPGLTDSQIHDYQIRNKKIVLDYIIPAYALLIDELTKLKGSGKNDSGLFYYPEGRDYYEYLTRYRTGSEKSMEEIIAMLEEAIGKGVVKVTSLTMSDPYLIDKYASFTSFPITDPEAIIDDLKTDISVDFPAAIPVNCDIKYVPDSLSEYLSPAMYLIPPIDRYSENNIYINGSDTETLSMIYTTIAHESYPGHLYQCVYFRDQNPNPIRSLLNFTGYDEGWATYVEMYSYHISGIDETLADFLEANNIVILCMYARADIGIHFEGWTQEDVIRYVNNFIGDQKIASMIYHTLLEEPAIYLPYAVGYLEIKELRANAEELLGDDFSAKDFHTFLLDIGPAQFKIIKNQMQTYYFLD